MIRWIAITLTALQLSACLADQGSFDPDENDWRKQVSHRNPHMRRHAAEEARLLPLAVVRSTLWNLLKYDNDDEAVGRAARTLGYMVQQPMNKDIDALLVAFDRVDEYYARGRVALALGAFAPKLDTAQSQRIITRFVKWLDDGGNAERYVAQALGDFGARAAPAITVLEKIKTTHKWKTTREAAAAALARIKH